MKIPYLLPHLIPFAMLCACGTNQEASVAKDTEHLTPSLVCTDPHTADAGYQVTFFKSGANFSRARLARIDFAGAHTVADLTDPLYLATRPIPDQPQDKIGFGTSNLSPGSYVVTLSTGNFAGIRYARATQRTQSGSAQLAYYPCRTR